MSIDVRQTAAGVTFPVYTQPRAAHDRIGGARAGALLVRVSAPPADGKANAALLRLLARSLDVPLRAVRLLKGHTHRKKLVQVQGVAPSRVRALLAPAEGEGEAC